MSSEPLQGVTPAVDTGSVLADRVIDMGVDGQWIDRMAREIADISAGTGRATFTLNPANLGKLQVDIIQGEEGRSEEHTSELQSLMRISYAVFCLKKKNKENRQSAKRSNYR